ncbi:MAG: hypothetical protein FJ044_00095 [Candidatus Cloacimonetes bacterium]|nr:hypothetical protein [Candidatus Cloacimonadota bacterium]
MEILLKDTLNVLLTLIGISVAWVIGYLLIKYKQKQAEKAMLWAICAGRLSLFVTDSLEELILRLENAKITFVADLILFLVICILLSALKLKAHQE